MKIYDCFVFFNELDLLELRLHELDSVVDKFVLVEATRTFQKEPKPLYFAENKARFAQFSNKIIHIVIDKFPGFFHKFRVPKAWDYENYQRNQVARGLSGCDADDVIILSDVDEIPRADKVQEFALVPGTKVFHQRYHSYYVNCVATECPQEDAVYVRDGYVYWRGSVMVDYADFTSAREIRKRRNLEGAGIVPVVDGGWHFTFMGGVERVQNKLDAWSHTKEKKYYPDALRDKAALKDIIERGEDLFGRPFRYQFVDIDDSFPVYVREHPERFAALIK